MDTPPAGGSAAAPHTAAVFHELIDELRALEDRLYLPDVPLDELSVLEGYKWIFSILAVGLDAHVWADADRPRFVDIVGPNRKWGGDNSDAFYQYAPIDPRRTYVVTRSEGRRRLPFAHRLRRSVGRPLLGAHRGNGQRPVARHRRRRHLLARPQPRSARRGLDQARTRRGVRHHPRLPGRPRPRGAGHLGHRGRRPAGHPPGGRRRPGPPPPGHAHLGPGPGPDRPHPPRAPRTRSTSPTRFPARPSAGPPATPPTPWAASPWTRTRRW